MAQNFQRSVSVVIVVAVILGSAASATDRPISVLRHVDCERQCPYYYFPICATNGNPKENRMFVNFCEMQAWNCDAKKKYRRTRNNQCKDYKEFVDDAWLDSLKPSKRPRHFTLLEQSLPPAKTN